MNFGPVSFQSNLNDLGDAILKFAEVYTKKDLPEILRDQANKLSCCDFGPDNRGLFQESAMTSPSEQTLTALPPQLNWHVKRVGRPVFTEGYQLLVHKRGALKGQFRRNKKGQITHKLIGQEGEMDRRIRHRLSQASGWLSPRLSRYGNGAAAAAGQRQRAQVVLVLTGNQLSVSISNTSTAALEVAERTGYIARALVNRRADLLVYANRKLAERTAELNNQKLPAPH